MRGARPERALDVEMRRVAALPAGTRALVACSGGPDSVALASLADRVAREDDWDLVLAHVNHAVRASSDQDECVALSVAARLGRSIRLARLGGDTRDEAGLRDARYAALLEIARAENARVILTAHTAEDQTETVLLALFRGTGLDGLAGMAERRSLGEGVELVRPLLRIARAELATELRRAALPYAVDPTNDDHRYRRNALRAHLTALREDFPHLDRAVARCAEIVRDELAATSRASDRRALRDRLRSQGALGDITFTAIEAVLGAADQEPPARDRTSPLLP